MMGVSERQVTGRVHHTDACQKAIDRGLAQRHADSDLIAALQNLKTPESCRMKTALHFASRRL